MKRRRGDGRTPELIMESYPAKLGVGGLGFIPSRGSSWQFEGSEKTRLVGPGMRTPGCEAGKITPILQMWNLRLRKGKRTTQVVL